MQSVNNGETEQHEREAGHEQRCRNLSGEDDVNGTRVVMAHDERAKAQVDVGDR